MKKPSPLQHFFYKLKHIGQKKLYCEAIANYLGNFNFAFFYDIDNFQIKDETIVFLKNWQHGIFQTKHGYQIIIYFPFTLNEVYNMFTKFYQWYKSDYFWTIPLWLRVTGKYDETGKMVSPPPQLYQGEDKRYVFKVRKLYTTWD